jgi:tRNA pseudouridine13 synthase
LLSRAQFSFYKQRMLPYITQTNREAFASVSFKEQPEDFVVEEIPLYEPSGSGTHIYYWIEKRGLTTHEAVLQLAKLFKKKQHEAGYAGLKDAKAITRQWISFEHVTAPAPDVEEGAPLKVLTFKRHGNKLKPGHLTGNRFIIRLRTHGNAELGKQLFAATQKAFEVLTKSGIPNFFGAQRFGRYGDNASLGKFLVQGKTSDFEQAMIAQSAPRNKIFDPKMRNLLVNSFQSELFNQVLTKRCPEIGKLIEGDLAWLHRNGAVFKVEDLKVEQARADAGEISPSGPMFGPKMIAPTDKAGEIEQEVLALSGVKAEDFGRREAESQPGARRSLRIFFLEKPESILQDNDVVVKFALPPGAYATVVLRELLPESADE